MQDRTQAITDSLQIELLQAQLDLMQTHYGALASTVQWAVGGVLALAALVVGVNIYLGAVSFNKEKKLIRSELKIVIKNGLAEVKDSLESLLATARKELDDTNLERSQKLQTDVEGRIDQKINGLNSKIELQARKHAGLELQTVIHEAEGSRKSGYLDYSMW